MYITNTKKPPSPTAQTQTDIIKDAKKLYSEESNIYIKGSKNFKKI